MHETREMPTSRLKEEIARILKDEGYIRDFTRRVTKAEHKHSAYGTLVVELKFGRNRERIITDLKRISKPGRRVYARQGSHATRARGMGTAILSTSGGISRPHGPGTGVGGEVVCFIW